MANPEKTYHCTEKGISVCYTNSNKHSFIEYDKRDNLLQIQLYGNSYKGRSYQDFEDNRYSFQQNKLYQRCLYGLKVCTAAEIAGMTFKEKAALQFNHKKTQQLINLSKWNATSQKVKTIYKNAFPRVNGFLDKFLNSTDEILPEDNIDINFGTLKDIGGKATLIDKLIENGILPTNFFTLKMVA